MLTLADLIQIASDEGVDPKDVKLAFQADADADIGGLDVLSDDLRGYNRGTSTTFILIPEVGHQSSVAEADALVGRDRLADVLEGEGYMADAYGDRAWKKIAEFLLKQGHSRDEAAAIMLSKNMRWADDSQGAGIGKRTNSASFIRYYNDVAKTTDWSAEARKLVEETL